MSLVRVWTPTGNNSDGGKKRLIVLHTMEGFTGPNGAQDCARYFQGDVGASSQVCIDNYHPGKLWEGVSRHDASWTQCAYNGVAVSGEQAGYASWSRGYWLNEQSTLLHVTAQWIAEESRALGIPIRALTSSEAQGGAAGVTYHSHLDYDGCGHADPGDGYPLDEVIKWALGGGTQPAPEPDPFDLEDQMPELYQGERTYMASFGRGAYKWVAFFCDDGVMGWPPQTIRVAAHQSGGGYQVSTLTVSNDNQKATADLGDACDGFSVHRTSPDAETWAPVGFNLGK
jgi:hypothetical protein